MPASKPLFWFTSNKIESHACANCRAPMMLVRINLVYLDLDALTFERLR
jgi:hypothetical protein